MTEGNSFLEKSSIKSERRLTMQTLTSTLHNITECVKAIINVVTYHGFEEVILHDENLNQLALLLNEEELYYAPSDPICKNLKISLFNIFITLSSKLGGAIKIIENVIIMKNIISILRITDKENAFLVDKMLRILENISHYENLNNVLLRYGLHVVLLKSILKAELLPISYRLEAFMFLTKYLKKNDSNNPLVRCIIFYFPQAFQCVMII